MEKSKFIEANPISATKIKIEKPVIGLSLETKYHNCNDSQVDVCLIGVYSYGETLSKHKFNDIKPNGNNKVSMELDDKKLTELHLYCCLKGVKINNDWSVDVTHKLLYQHES